ncbi:TetR/AcrR family transcriptional regulator [Actinocrispum wychmicini]|uniref:TetR family transcriptional regulator n=1 Tax=Actinocrispum wychmicini TaxID=1213861 RepID=A0A4R2J0N4_9PSEU|nr:TetR/AcrR family transcriptional regulator [Actinocrispum wychmicini]TCO48785.1 TetR family transcriptional regulator [Actinocrispum wychmicini]
MSADVSRIRLRVDARQNRDRIVEVARRLFAERGLDVPMAAIARHAGVGVATLYRRFPTKESLVKEVFAEQFAECVSVVDDALADPDPWRGFCTVIEKVTVMHAVDRGFCAAFGEAVDFEQERDRGLRGFADLVRRAKETGQLRADFVPGDVTLVFKANGGLAADSVEAAVAASRRLVAYLLEAFRGDRTDPVIPLPPPAPLSLGDIAHLSS